MNISVHIPRRTFLFILSPYFPVSPSGFYQELLYLCFQTFSKNDMAGDFTIVLLATAFNNNWIEYYLIQLTSLISSYDRRRWRYTRKSFRVFYSPSHRYEDPAMLCRGVLSGWSCDRDTKLKEGLSIMWDVPLLHLHFFSSCQCPRTTLRRANTIRGQDG